MVVPSMLSVEIELIGPLRDRLQNAKKVFGILTTYPDKTPT